jgi:hypothetical protein
VLLHRARTNVELPGNLFVAASLHQQIQDLLVARRDFDLRQIDHMHFSSMPGIVVDEIEYGFS